MRVHGAFLPLMLAAFSSTTASQAADMRGTYASAAQAPLVYSDSGFYLRGDVGYSVNRPGNIVFAPNTASTERTLSHKANNSGLVGIGAGYQVNALLRGDITAEYRTSAAYGFLNRIENLTTPADYYANDAHGRVSSKLVLLNGYVNLLTWNRFTPFIGVGVGLASVSMTKFHTTGVGPGNLNGPGNIIGGIGADVTRIKPAIALHAGISYSISQNWHAELGYRYVNMGTIKGSTTQCWGYVAVATGSYSSTNCQPSHGPRIKNFGMHDLKFGLRYMFATPAALPVFTPQPGLTGVSHAAPWAGEQGMPLTRKY